MPLFRHFGQRDRSARLLPLLQPLSFQMSPPTLTLQVGRVPAATDIFLLWLDLLLSALGYNVGPYTTGPDTTQGSGTHPWQEQ